MNWLKKLLGIQTQPTKNVSKKELQKEPQKTISSGVTLGGYSSAYQGHDMPSTNDNDHYNPLNPFSPYFYGSNHEDYTPSDNQEQNSKDITNQEQTESNYSHYHCEAPTQHHHDHCNNQNDSTSSDTGYIDSNNSFGADY